MGDTRHFEAALGSRRGLWLMCWVLGLGAVVASAAAIVYGDRYRALRELENLGVEVSPDSATAAVRKGSRERLVLLRRAGLSLNAADSRGVVPVLAAVEARNADMLVYFRKRSRDVEFDVRAPDGEGLAEKALRTLDQQVAGLVLQSGVPRRMEMRLADGSTEPAVIWLVRQRQAGLLRLVVESPGVDCDVTDPEGRTALMHAAAMGETTLAGVLLEAGANPARKDPAGNTAADSALERGDAAMLRLLLDHAQPGSGAVHALHAAKAFEMGRPDLLEMLLSWGVQVSKETQAEWLASSVESGDETALRTLIDAGWRPEPAAGRDLLRGALERGRYEVMIPLLASGSSPEGLLTQALRCGHHSLAEVLFTCVPPQADERARLLEEGIVRGNRAICRRLLELEASLEGNLPSGQRPLFLAIAASQNGIVEDLLDLGADPEAPVVSPVSEEFLEVFAGREGAKRARTFLQKDEGIRPLMLAALLGDLETAKRLMQFGARPNRFTEKWKYYPVNFATQGGHHDVTRLVLGADPNRRDRRIEISLGRQEAVVYRDGEAWVTTRVSTGRKGYATPKGTFVITNKHRSWVSTLYHSSMPYFMRLNCSDFGLHQGYVPQYPASHGCVRVPAGTARKLFDVMQVGDLVEITP